MKQALPGGRKCLHAQRPCLSPTQAAMRLTYEAVMTFRKYWRKLQPMMCVLDACMVASKLPRHPFGSFTPHAQIHQHYTHEAKQLGVLFHARSPHRTQEAEQPIKRSLLCMHAFHTKSSSTSAEATDAQQVFAKRSNGNAHQS